jgi:phosphoribosyl 1,2-cyclic phosphodiesterase
VKVSFWGVRGCIPAPGPQFTKYGGNTSCVSVKSDSGELLVLDAGTGIIELGRSLMRGEFGRGEGRASLFLTHAHWDHIQGFPFFVPIFIPGNHLDIYGSSGSSAMLESILEGQMDPYYMPIQSLRNLGADLTFQELGSNDHEIGAIRVRVCEVPHGTISSLAIRLDCDGHSLVFLPDVGYGELGPSDELLALVNGAELLIHDCTFSPEDYETRACRGYSSYEHAAKLATACSVKTLVMFHYDQDYDDRDIDELQKNCRKLLDGLDGGKSIDLRCAIEGLELECCADQDC